MYFIVATLLAINFSVVSGEILLSRRGERKTYSTPSSNCIKIAQFRLPLSGSVKGLQEHGTLRSCVARLRRAGKSKLA
jgi:hypothetical protein